MTIGFSLWGNKRSGGRSGVPFYIFRSALAVATLNVGIITGFT